MDTQVTILMQSILGSKVIFQINTKFQMSSHDGLERLVPSDFMFLGGDKGMELIQSHTLFFVGIITNSTINQIYTTQKESSSLPKSKLSMQMLTIGSLEHIFRLQNIHSFIHLGFSEVMLLSSQVKVCDIREPLNHTSTEYEMQERSISPTDILFLPTHSPHLLWR
jgi:hypothetical protein